MRTHDWKIFTGEILTHRKMLLPVLVIPWTSILMIVIVLSGLWEEAVKRAGGNNGNGGNGNGDDDRRKQRDASAEEETDTESERRQRLRRKTETRTQRKTLLMIVFRRS